MLIPNPFTALSTALHAACTRDIPGHPQTRQHHVARRALDASQPAGRARNAEGLKTIRRPYPSECMITMFPQVWPAMAGNGDGAELTYVVLVRWVKTDYRAVYFGEGGQLAYLIPPHVNVAKLDECICRQVMPGADEAAKLGWLPAH